MHPPLCFCIVSFEGPDPYARAGGLGVRVTHLADTLAQRGHETHLFFVGAPDAPPQSTDHDGLLRWHRWGQWISAHHPSGVYAGEDEKRRDLNASLPPFLVDAVIRPALGAGKLPVILAEEWHTAEALIHIHDQLEAAGLAHRCVLFWNANNTMSFDQVPWARLDAVAQITAVSHYMKHLMWSWGVNALVIPNGIPADLLAPVPTHRIEAVRAALGASASDAVMLFKVGRFDPAKRWMMAIDAAAQLKARGHHVVFPLSGGAEPHGDAVRAHARAQGLTISDINGQPSDWPALLDLLRAAPRADLYNLHLFLQQPLLRPFYAAADAVLANSGHEPFGLVGLEAMAAGGVVFTGSTGEEYAFSERGARTLDTDDPTELTAQIEYLRSDPDLAASMRAAAREQAANYTWDHAVDRLVDKVVFAAQQQGAVIYEEGRYLRTPQVRDLLIYTVVHQPHRLRLPAVTPPRSATPETLHEVLFDAPMNERYFRQVSSTCYYPATERFLSLVKCGLKLAIGFSLSFIDQAERWDPALLQRFQTLVAHDHVELVAVEPSHSFALLWDLPLLSMRMQYAADRLEEVFGVRPTVADTTELMMSDTIYHALDQAGFNGGLMDGRPWVMDWRSPMYLYHHDAGSMKLLTRHYPLSDDVGYRFSNQSWDGWPLTADTYARWLASLSGHVVVLGWDFETFGEHHRAESGIFEFLDALPEAAAANGLSFQTPSDVINQHGAASYDLPLPAFASTWAGSGGLEFFLGNDAQHAVFHLMMQAHQKARLTNNPDLIEQALRLAQSDNLHLIQWHGRSGSEAEVSAYFTPREWWSLTPDGIIDEIQRVYKHFINALDDHLPIRAPLKGRPPERGQGTRTTRFL
jgi:alpha-amylase